MELEGSPRRWSPLNAIFDQESPQQRFAEEEIGKGCILVVQHNDVRPEICVAAWPMGQQRKDL